MLTESERAEYATYATFALDHVLRDNLAAGLATCKQLICGPNTFSAITVAILVWLDTLKNVVDLDPHDEQFWHTQTNVDGVPEGLDVERTDQYLADAQWTLDLLRARATNQDDELAFLIGAALRSEHASRRVAFCLVFVAGNIQRQIAAM